MPRFENPDLLLRLPARLLNDYQPVEMPTGYRIRGLREGDFDAWKRMHRRAVPSFSEKNLVEWWGFYQAVALPNGIFFAKDAQGRAIASAGCIHESRDGAYPFTGQLAWVVTDPDHQGRGIAAALCTRCVHRLIEIGYESILVQTGDDLLPAIRLYLRLGFEPMFYEPGMEERWRDIYRLNQTAWPSQA